MNEEILIVDDEADIRMLVKGVLQDEGYSTREAHHSDAALASIKTKQPNLILLDIWLEGSKLDGLEILAHIQENWPEVPVIMISGHGNIETAVQAIKIGAYDFIEKPFKTDRLLHLCRRALEASQLKSENKTLKLGHLGPSELNGNSSVIQIVKQAIQKVAPTKSRVMILGEPGTGKGIVAQMVHDTSEYAKGPFVVLNCALIDQNNFDEEVFGIEDATGKIKKLGLLEQAHTGTLFIDEVSDLNLESQAKLLKALQTNKFKRKNGRSENEVDVRIISSSNKNLEAKMNNQEFRQDLFYRLNVFPIMMPALRERKADLTDLIQNFMISIAKSQGRQPMSVAEEVIAVFQSYAWPGNVRQLRNVIEWFFIMQGPETVEVKTNMLPPEFSSRASELIPTNNVNHNEIMALPLRQAREMFEREYLLSQVNRFGGNISRTASFIGMERSALHRKLKMLGIQGGERDEDDMASEETNIQQSRAV